jgi:hypothetical protein
VRSRPLLGSGRTLLSRGARPRRNARVLVAWYVGRRAAGMREGSGSASEADPRGWAVPGSNGRPPACKARAVAAVCCRLSLRWLGEPRPAPGCCPLLRFAASKALPRDRFNCGDPLPLSRESDSELSERRHSCFSSKPVIRVVSACALAFSREPAVRGGSDDGARRAARRPLGGLLLLRVAGSDASRWKSVGGPARVERERGRLFEAHLGPCRLRPVPARRAVTRACGCEEALFELGRDVGIGARAGRARRAQ